MAEKIYDLLIIGAGPTGINCGIEAKKAGLDYLILEKGLLVNSIYHFPNNMTFFSTSLNLEIGDIPFISHNEKPTRREALEYYRRLVQSWDLNIKYKTKVTAVNKSESIFKIETADRSYFTKYLIVCTGFYDNPRLLNVPGEELPKVKHYYDEAHPYIGQKIAVVGAANSACDVALETWQKGSDVTMIVRSGQLYEKVKYWILPNIQNRIKEGSIKAYFNSEIVKIEEKFIHIKNDEGIHKIENDVVLAMTGYKPDFGFLESIGIEFVDQETMIPQFDEHTLESNIPKLYLAGVVNSGLKTSTLFIENTRHHGKMIVQDILKKQSD